MARDNVSPAAIARKAREIADNIEALPNRMGELVRAASEPSVSTIMVTLNLGALRLFCLDVYSFVERHWTSSHADRLRRDLEGVFLHAEAFREEELPARRALFQESGTWYDWDNGAGFLIRAVGVGRKLRQWAHDIECKGSKGARKQGKANSKRGGPANLSALTKLEEKAWLSFQRLKTYTGVARDQGVCRQVATRRVKNADAKLKTYQSRSKKRDQSLPTDHRGQPAVDGKD